MPSGKREKAKALICLRAVFRRRVLVNVSVSNTTERGAIIKTKIDAHVVYTYVGPKDAVASIPMATAKLCDKMAEVVSPATHRFRALNGWNFVMKMFALELIQQQLKLIFPCLVRS